MAVVLTCMGQSCGRGQGQEQASSPSKAVGAVKRVEDFNTGG